MAIAHKHAQPHWYIAYVRSCQERKVSEALGKMGYEHYLPVRREMHQWSDRKKLVEVLVIPRMIFIHCTNKDRIPPLQQIPYMLGYLSTNGVPAVVRDAEMETFRTMVEQKDRALIMNADMLEKGDRVRILTGPFEGCEAELTRISGRRHITVRLDSIGTVSMDLQNDKVEKITKE